MKRGALSDCALAGVLGGLLYGLVLGHRLDYAGHFLAGMGGTLLLLAGLALLDARPRGWSVVLVTLVSVALGAAIEASIFRLAIFDPVDFCNQSVGAVLAACGVVARPGGPRVALGLCGLAGVFLVAGFVLAFA